MSFARCEEALSDEMLEPYRLVEMKDLPVKCNQLLE